MKMCTKCKILKNEEDFTSRMNRGKRVLYSWCRTCNIKHVKEWQLKNRERATKSIHLRTRPYLIHRKKYCERCGFIAVHECQLDVDHIDDNHENDDPSNLMTLCANCHRLKSRARQLGDQDKKTAWLLLHGFTDKIPKSDIVPAESTAETNHVNVRSENPERGS